MNKKKEPNAFSFDYLSTQSAQTVSTSTAKFRYSVTKYELTIRAFTRCFNLLYAYDETQGVDPILVKTVAGLRGRPAS